MISIETTSSVVCGIVTTGGVAAGGVVGAAVTGGDGAGGVPGCGAGVAVTGGVGAVACGAAGAGVVTAGGVAGRGVAGTGVAGTGVAGACAKAMPPLRRTARDTYARRARIVADNIESLRGWPRPVRLFIGRFTPEFTRATRKPARKACDLNALGGRPAIKMNGIGNEIVVLDLRDGTAISGNDARAIGRMPGLAFDQLMAIEPAASSGHDAKLSIFNIDGSRAESCGNGTRCVAAFLRRATNASRLRFESDGGLLDVLCEDDGLITVDMGQPSFDWTRIPLSRAADTTHVALDPPVCGAPADFAAVSMGNPHAVFFVDDVASVDLARVGPAIETHPLFPNRVNASFAQRVGDTHIRLRVWERGAGATRACGTAACATLVAAARRRITGRNATVSLPGGDLTIAWRDADDHVLMTGPTEFEFEQLLDAALLPDATV